MPSAPDPKCLPGHDAGIWLRGRARERWNTPSDVELPQRRRGAEDHVGTPNELRGSVGGASALAGARESCLPEVALLGFASHALSSDERHRVREHAARCSDCRLLLSAARDALRCDAAVEPELAPGTVLNARYRVRALLGRGGMGLVYEADDRLLEQRVALKTLRADLAADPEALRHLKDEARLARSIAHPHVCRVYDLGAGELPSGPLHYLTMELLAGPCLRSLLRAGPLPFDQVSRFAEQLLSALKAAHDAGVLHRDLKPDNVMLRSDAHPWHAVVTDFGLARAIPAGQSHLTISRHLVGSAAYLAPEQIVGSTLTEATDLYAFGVVLFELLTGRLPFVASTAIGTAVLRLTREPPRPSQVAAGIDPRYDELVLRCLSRDPAKRFPSAEACLEELRRRSEPRPPVAPRRRWVARLPATPLGGLAGLCLGLWVGSAAAPSGPAANPADSVATRTSEREPAEPPRRPVSAERTAEPLDANPIPVTAPLPNEAHHRPNEAQDQRRASEPASAQSHSGQAVSNAPRATVAAGSARASRELADARSEPNQAPFATTAEPRHRAEKARDPRAALAGPARRPPPVASATPAAALSSASRQKLLPGGFIDPFAP